MLRFVTIMPVWLIQVFTSVLNFLATIWKWIPSKQKQNEANSLEIEITSLEEHRTEYKRAKDNLVKNETRLKRLTYKRKGGDKNNQ